MKDVLTNTEIFDPVVVDAFCKIDDSLQHLYQSDAMKESAK